ncbi:DUF2264 domain-containing protein [Aureibaculum sp. A20]|uniref:DUF2264 domain-containing protein n=1 Tax=Aureibaculum flavum TaxID=2795986 RepID=A0ABS0WVS8_9FLAO|nr:DUF2264 domain-containing protein [Aureibaculum flavum]MBJ2176062.1 DUF2264 domain-containing protein [Aureibaculum flavum]
MKYFKLIITISILVYNVSWGQNKTESHFEIKTSTGLEDRAYSIELMQKIADPILVPLSQQKLHEMLPLKDWEKNNDRCDYRTTYIQAAGRTLSGLAPWLSLGVDDSEEGKLRAKYIDLSLKAIVNITNPESKDYQFGKETETYERIVHNAYVAYPLLIATDQLWAPLSVKQKEDIIIALKTHRKYKPFNNNWLLFASVIEAAIWKLTDSCDVEKIENGVNKHMEWYLGDGMYGDGPQFHWDYYNSFVIQPLLLEILKVCKEKDHALQDLLPKVIGRAQRYAEIQEHLISPEGTYPVIGRSSVYRIATFQHLGYMVYRNNLPKSLDPGSTRAALMAITKRLMEPSGTFDDKGYLNPGVVGEQLEARDVYTLTGALYMSTMGLTHLGLPADAPFWTEPAGKWFQQKVWDGDVIGKQHEYYGQ